MNYRERIALEPGKPRYAMDNRMTLAPTVVERLRFFARVADKVTRQLVLASDASSNSRHATPQRRDAKQAVALRRCTVA